MPYFLKWTILKNAFFEVAYLRSDEFFELLFFKVIVFHFRSDLFGVIGFEVTHFSKSPFFEMTHFSNWPFSEVIIFRSDRFRIDPFFEVTLSEVTFFRSDRFRSDPFFEVIFRSDRNPYLRRKSLLKDCVKISS